jgi:hypothetical protein
MRRVFAAVALACLTAVPVAFAARAVSYQGYTAQGHQIRFKKSSAGVLRMSITIRASCFNDSQQNQGDFDFTLRATDNAADPVKRGRFRTVLAGKGQVPDATISGRFNRHGVARGTIVAVGRARGPDNEDLGTCKSSRVAWTAGPL